MRIGVLSGGAYIILIPEVPFDLDEVSSRSPGREKDREKLQYRYYLCLFKGCGGENKICSSGLV